MLESLYSPDAPEENPEKSLPDDLPDRLLPETDVPESASPDIVVSEITMGEKDTLAIKDLTETSSDAPPPSPKRRLPSLKRIS
jgi:hypothetical protein